MQKKLTISDLDGFADICNEKQLLTVVGGECSPTDIPPALSPKQQEEMEKQVIHYVESHSGEK